MQSSFGYNAVPEGTAAHGRGVRDILRGAVNQENIPSGDLGTGTEIAGLFAKIGLESDIPELRGYELKPPHSSNDRPGHQRFSRR
jgi:hypothetical protein